MIVTCTKCTTRLQLDDAKIPSQTFNVRCPKCGQTLSAEPPARPANGALDGAIDATRNAPRDTTHVAPRDAPLPARAAVEPACASPVAATDEAELVRMLASLMRRAAAVEPVAAQSADGRSGHAPKRALVCVGSVHRDKIARGLAASLYEVFVAENTAQATERMREEKTDVLVLDNEFDMSAQGATFISRELGTMRMADRRRLLLVQLTATARTGDAHAAFLNNANLILNNNDVETLPQVLEKNTRELGELYRDFDKALHLAGL